MRINPLSGKTMAVICCCILVFASSILLIHNVNSNKISRSIAEENEEGEAMDDPIGRAQYEFNKLKDPATGEMFEDPSAGYRFHRS